MDKIRSDGRKVEFVRVVCHTSGIWPNGMMSDNHWSIYLVFGNNSSVRMNMRGDLDNQKGTLEWSTLDYDVTTSAIQYWDYKVGPGVTVAHIHGLVMGNGRDQYNMSGGGSGCRYWIYVIMKDLEGKRWLTMNNAGNDLWPKLLVQYSKTGHKRPLPMVEGKFISKSTTAVGKSSSSGSSGTSAGTSKSTSAAPTRVKVTSYITDGQLCYAWGNTVDERSYANEWVSVKDSGGTTQLLHRSKNLVSVHP